METIIKEPKFKEIKARSQEAILSKIYNRKAKKILRLDENADLIDLNSNKPNKKRAFDRYQIKERLRKKLEKKKKCVN